MKQVTVFVTFLFIASLSVSASLLGLHYYGILPESKEIDKWKYEEILDYMKKHPDDVAMKRIITTAIEDKKIIKSEYQKFLKLREERWAEENAREIEATREKFLREAKKKI